MRIVLVSMPWQALEYPSIAVGILHERVKQCRGPHEVLDFYGHLRWAEYVLERSDGRVTPEDYAYIANNGIFVGEGDWVFTPALYGTPEWRVAEYERYRREAGADPTLVTELHRWTPDFIERLADEVLALSPDVVGLTSTFMQNVPSLALARVLKQRLPGLVTIMGGSNCDGPQGRALHRNFPFLDFVVRGEGEEAFVQLLDALSGHGRLKDIAGLCWHSESSSVVNPERTHSFPMRNIPAPNYDAYFEQLANSSLGGFVEPKLVLEGARGCWWGEKHHCTFCGLNGSSMKFRSKPPEEFWNELRRAVEKYRVLDIITVDNIIDMKYFKGLLPHLSEAGWDLRIHYEVKSNLTLEQIKSLKAAGIVHVQPGIENLSSRVLKLMDKGVSGCHNVQALRGCEEYGLTVSWNYLYGFPGETESDYDSVIEQMPAMVHLQPPRGASRIALERFSPNFDNPALGFNERKPAAFYFIIYDLPEQELMELAYLFETVKLGIVGDIETRLHQAVSRWQEGYHQSELSYREDGHAIYIRDRREGWAPGDYVLELRRDVSLFRNLKWPMSVMALYEMLHKSGIEVMPEDVEAQLAEWRRLGWVFEEGGRFSSLVTSANPQRVRIRPPGSGGAHT